MAGGRLRVEIDTPADMTAAQTCEGREGVYELRSIDGISYTPSNDLNSYTPQSTSTRILRKMAGGSIRVEVDGPANMTAAQTREGWQGIYELRSIQLVH